MLMLLPLVALTGARIVTSISTSASATGSLHAIDTAFYNNTIFSSNTTFSNGNAAKCVTGKAPVPVSATGVKLLFSGPTNQSVATGLIQQLNQLDSTIATEMSGGQSTIRGTFQIEVTLCFPADSIDNSKVDTVQILTHGIGLDKSYWDIAPGYSYVNAAASAGYATLAYNRLGVGNSDHPDPINVVQSFTDVEILHGLTQLLRKGTLGSGPFKNIVGVGHSYGSIVELAQTAKYPTDVDAVVLTSFVNQLVYLPQTVIANNPAIANINDPTRFGRLPNGYLVHDTPISVQLPFFRFPYFDPNSKSFCPNYPYNDSITRLVFANQYAAKQTYSFGQQFTLPGIYSAAGAFKGPVDVVIGQYDFPFCLAACDKPTDQAAATIPALYPAAAVGSQHFIVPNSGHYMNAHYAAPTEFSQINAFLKDNGF